LLEAHHFFPLTVGYIQWILQDICNITASVPTTSLDSLKRTIAYRLKAARMAKRLSQEELALEASVNRSYASALECGTANPAIGLLHRIATALDVEVADLLDHERQRS
jgi:DNA-binding XRE family transcriptional regulator